MSRNSFGAGALATGVILLLTVFGAESSGSAAGQTIVEQPAVEETAASTDETETVRFVAHEVVQPLPGDDENALDAERAEGADSLSELVSEIPADAPLSSDVRCLAQAIYFEARGESLAGQLAVGRVIVNRAESGQFPDDYCGVVTQRSQFSFVRGGHIPSANTSSAAWRRAKAIARIAHEELWDSPVSDALYFHARRVKPAWASRKLARATIERHIFYR